jgi:predicted unusual protein kinase regulating ubiquinone biosynthesis (AarF/ABC1/UbiB family)
MNHILPAEYTRLFSRMFDKAPPVSREAMRRVFAEEFGGQAPEDVFVAFDETPVASASIAQVHKAVTADGRTVAVKIQKPYIEAQVRRDALASSSRALPCLEFSLGLSRVFC